MDVRCLEVGRTSAQLAFELRAGGRPCCAVETTYERGLWFRTPEAYDGDGNFRASIYLRPLAIWAIEEALRRSRRDR